VLLVMNFNGKIHKYLPMLELHRGESEDSYSPNACVVNGALVTELGTQVDPDRDRIEVDGETFVSNIKRTSSCTNRAVLSDLDSPDSRSDKPLAIDLIQTKDAALCGRATGCEQ